MRREKRQKKIANRYFGHHKDEHITVTHQHSRKGSGSPVQQVFRLPADDVPRNENNLIQRDRQTDGQTDRQTDRQRDKQTDRGTNRQTEGQTDRQT